MLHAIEETEEQLQCLVEGYKARNVDGVHDLLLRLGDLSRDELQKRAAVDDAGEFVTKLVRARRVVEISVAGERRLIAVEDAGRYRDALGAALPAGLAGGVSGSRSGGRAGSGAAICADAWAVHRGGVRRGDSGCRWRAWRRRWSGWWGLGAWWRADSGRAACIASGAMWRCCGRFGGKSLARLRKEVEPVEQRVLARLITRWQGVVQPRQGAGCAAGCDRESAGCGVAGFDSGDGDSAGARARISPGGSGYFDCGGRGDVGWVRCDRRAGWASWAVSGGEVGGACGRWRRDSGDQGSAEQRRAEREARVVEYLRAHGASFFQQVHDGSRRRLSGRDAGCDLEPGVARIADQRCAACAAGVLRAGGELEAGEAGASADGPGWVPVATNDSAGGAGAVVAECGGVCGRTSRRRRGAMRWRSSC